MEGPPDAPLAAAFRRRPRASDDDPSPNPPPALRHGSGPGSTEVDLQPVTAACGASADGLQLPDAPAWPCNADDKVPSAAPQLPPPPSLPPQPSAPPVNAHAPELPLESDAQHAPPLPPPPPLPSDPANVALPPPGSAASVATDAASAGYYGWAYPAPWGAAAAAGDGSASAYYSAYHGAYHSAYHSAYYSGAQPGAYCYPPYATQWSAYGTALDADALPPPPPSARQQRQMHNPAAVVMTLIRKADNMDALARYIERNNAHLNGNHVSFALQKLSRLCGGPPRAAAARALLFTLLSHAERMAGDCDARNVCNLFYALGKLGVAPPALLQQLAATTTAERLAGATPQELANALYGLAKMPRGDCPRAAEAVSLVLQRAMQPLLPRCNARDLSNAVYALGVLGRADASFLAAWLADTAGRQFADFNPQDLSNALYALGQLQPSETGQAGAALRAAVEAWIGRASAVGLSAFNDQEATNSLWALATLGIKSEEFVASWVGMVLKERRLPRFTTQVGRCALHYLPV